MLDAIARCAGNAPASNVGRNHSRMADLLRNPTLQSDHTLQLQFAQLYETSLQEIFPTEHALKRATSLMSGIAQDFSLQEFSHECLRQWDIESVADPDLANLLKVLQSRLAGKKVADDIVSSAQAFEHYCEIRTFRHLKKHGFRPVAVATAKGKKRPDFECRTPSNKTFFVEVKAFDQVEGEFNRRKQVDDSILSSIDIESQQRAGARIAISEQVLSPFAEKGFGRSQSKDVAETYLKKFISAFKVEQFQDGPTFAFAFLDRLIVPGRQSSIVPVYHESNQAGSNCLTGTLWHSAYGKAGMLCLSPYEFEGKGTYGGTLDHNGFFAGVSPHPAMSAIFVDRGMSDTLVYGLTNPMVEDHEDWTQDDTELVLSTLCDVWNDDQNSYGFNLAHHDSLDDFPPHAAPKAEHFHR